MSKAKLRDPDISEEHDFSRAKRGVYYERAMKGVRVHIVTDEEDKARQQRLGNRPPQDD